MYKHGVFKGLSSSEKPHTGKNKSMITIKRRLTGLTIRQIIIFISRHLLFFKLLRNISFIYIYIIIG